MSKAEVITYAFETFNLPKRWDLRSCAKLLSKEAGESGFIPFHNNKRRDFEIFEKTGGLCRPSSRLVRRRTSELPASFWAY